MSVANQFKSIEKIVDCTEFREKFESLMVYMKLTTENVNDNSFFDWMALIESGDYDDNLIKEDIYNNVDCSEDDFLCTKNKLIELNILLGGILGDVEKKTGVSIYLGYDDERYCAYFEFVKTQLFDMVLKLHNNNITIKV